MAFTKLRSSVDAYAQGKAWYWHVPLWLFGAYLFVQMLGFNLVDPQPFAVSVMHAFDFTLHEFAHVFTGWLPPLVTAAAGSGSESLLGGLLVYGAFQFRNYFASLFCFLWLMLVCMGTGSYMADALPQRIPLVSLGGALSGSENTIHDWNFIFGKLHLLDASYAIGNTMRIVGIAAGVFGLLFSAWIIYKMAAAAGQPKSKMTTEELEALKAAAAGAPAASAKAPVYPTATRGNLAERPVHTPAGPQAHTGQPPTSENNREENNAL